MPPLRKGDPVIALFDILSSEGDVVAKTGDRGFIQARIKGSSYRLAEFGNRTALLSDDQVSLIGAHISKHLKVGDTAMCTRTAVTSEDDVLFSVGDICELLGPIPDGLVLVKFSGGQVTEMQLEELAPQGKTVGKGNRVGDQVVSCIEFSEGLNNVKPGDVGTILRKITGVADKIEVKFPNCSTMQVATSWQIMPQGAELPGGYSPGDEVVCCVNAGLLKVLTSGIVLGLPLYKADDLIRVKFQTGTISCVDARWNVARKGQEVSPGWRVADVVKAKVKSGKKVAQGDTGVVVGPPMPDFPGTIRVLFKNNHIANISPDVLELVKPADESADPRSSLEALGITDWESYTTRPPDDSISRASTRLSENSSLNSIISSRLPGDSISGSTRLPDESNGDSSRNSILPSLLPGESISASTRLPDESSGASSRNSIICPRPPDDSITTSTRLPDESNVHSTMETNETVTDSTVANETEKSEETGESKDIQEQDDGDESDGEKSNRTQDSPPQKARTKCVDDRSAAGKDDDRSAFGKEITINPTSKHGTTAPDRDAKSKARYDKVASRCCFCC